MRVSETNVIASLCRKSFYDFVLQFWHTVVPEKLVANWHIKYICDRLQAAAERTFRGEAKLKDVLLNVPPGTSKSTIVSIMFPAWVWTRMPSARIIGASYSHLLAMDLSRKCRLVIESDLYRRCFPEIVMSESQDTKSHFVNTRGGMRYAVGSGGSVLGMHAHFILIDDPINPEQAVSDVELETINRWIRSTLLSRKVDAAVTLTVMVMQRLHQNDPSAQMLEGKRVEHVRLPATLEYAVNPPSLAAEYTDGLLDPIRLPRSILEEKLQEMGQYAYAGQMGQNPVPPGGGMFQVDRIKVRPTPKLEAVVRFWDKAGTEDKGTRLRGKGTNRAAWTVGVKMGVTRDGHLHLLDVIRVRLDSFKRERLIVATARADGKRVTVGLEQEPGSGGQESAENTVKRLLGYRVKVVAPRGDKVLRADPFSVQVNAGNVSIPGEDLAWWKNYKEELAHFPFSTYLDQVDASSGAFTLLWKGKRRVGGLKSRQGDRKVRALRHLFSVD